MSETDVEKNGGGGEGEDTDFILERPRPEEYPKSEKKVSVSAKILLLHLWSEIFSAKYCLNGPFKDVRANCFCASLLRTQIHTPRRTSSARAKQ